jgi:hypothetical protein
MKSKKGKIYTVVITDKTKFGTTKHPANRGQFTVGTIARVTGHRSGSTITAARVTLPLVRPGSTAPPGELPPAAVAGSAGVPPK